jgi:hypothetical protein
MRVRVCRSRATPRVLAVLAVALNVGSCGGADPTTGPTTNQPGNVTSQIVDIEIVGPGTPKTYLGRVMEAARMSPAR